MPRAREHAKNWGRTIPSPPRTTGAIGLSDSIEWRWADVDGSERVVAFGELSEALASKALPPFVLGLKAPRFLEHAAGDR